MPLQLVGFEMIDAYGRPLRMAEDGEITVPRGVWGRASADGNVTFPDGSLRGRLLDDGRVEDGDGAQLAIINEDGEATVGEIELSFDTEGWVQGGDMGQAIRLVAPKAEAKRVAMVVFVLTQLRPRPRAAMVK